LGTFSLAKEDDRLIYLLFFEEVTIKDAAQILRCSRKTIYNRRKCILSELRSILHDLGIVGGVFYGALRQDVVKSSQLFFF
jgi:DNA-directed RNA polymerase specialized sigma24 family protein